MKHWQRIFQVIEGLAMVMGSCLACDGQQAGSIDLTHVTQHDLRRPPAQPGDPVKRTGVEHHYNDCSPGSADLAIQTSLIAVDRNDYKEGDEQWFEIRLTNIGSTPAKIPFSDDLANLQPADPGGKFAYFMLRVQVWVVGGQSWNSNTGGAVMLYGSENHPESFLELKPGEWAEVFGEGKINLPNDVSMLARNPVTGVKAEATIEKKESIFTSTETATVARAVCLKQTLGPDLPITVQPARLEHP